MRTALTGRAYGWRFAALAIALVLASTHSAAADAEKRGPVAADLVRAIIAQENKFEQVTSLYLRFEGRWTTTPEGIARNRAALEKRHPGETIDVDKHSNLWPEMTEVLELAFDGRRARKLSDHHKSSHRLTVFDGQRGIDHSQAFTLNSERYVLSDSPKELFRFTFLDLSWLRVGAHELWFAQEQFTPETRMKLNGLPEDFAIVDEGDYRGRRCYLLENRKSHRHLHVGVDDGRLYGLIVRGIPRGTDMLPAIKRASGLDFAAISEVRPWLESLSKDEQQQYHERLKVEQFELTRLFFEHYMDDYRELAPGFWFPAVQGYPIRDLEDNSGVLTGSRELRLVEAKVNEPLDDSLFTIELKDGVNVDDLRYDPRISYKQQADRTPEEFAKLVDDRQQVDAMWKKANAARDALVGRPAPEFGEVAWVNSQPKTLESLRGKLVLLDFWATSCGPCRNDFPIATAIHSGAQSSDIVLIGVHVAGAEATEIEKFAKAQAMGYPILIDLPAADKEGGFGQLFKQLGVNAIPYAILIDREGRIAAHGSLHRMREAAEKLKNKPQT